MLIVSLWAEFKVGDKIESFKLPDQFENSITFNSEIKILIVVFEKDTSTIVNEFLKERDREFLKINSAIFVADISAMPSFVATMFALPKMRKYPYSVALIYDKFGEQFNMQAKSITVYRLKNSKIEDILYLKSLKELEKIF